MPKVTIIDGPTTTVIENETVETVSDMIAELREQGLLRDGSTNVLRNGEAVADDAVLEDGDELSFGKPAGQKGKRA